MEARITRADNNHVDLKDANLMLDIRIPVKNKKLTLNDVVDVMLDGFNKINNRLDIIETDIHDLKIRVTNIEDTLVRHNIRLTSIENTPILNNIR